MENIEASTAHTYNTQNQTRENKFINKTIRQIHDWLYNILYLVIHDFVRSFDEFLPCGHSQPEKDEQNKKRTWSTNQ